MSGGDSWRFRAVIFFSLLLVWAAAALLRAVWLAGPRSAEYIAQGEKMARFHGTLPAMRGRILDRAGRMLAWSERYFDLYLTLPEGMTPEDETFDAVRKTVKDLKIPEAGTGTPVLLKRDLAPAELLALEPVVKNNRAFRIESRVERIAVSNPAARSRRSPGSPCVPLPGKYVRSATCGVEGHRHTRAAWSSARGYAC